MNNTAIMQNAFFRYVTSKSLEEKNNVISELQEKLPNEINNINRLKSDIDELEYNAAMSFIKNIFKISDDQIDFQLLEQIESSIANKTVVIPKIETKNFILEKYDDLNKSISNEELVIKENSVVINNNSTMYIANNNDKSIFANYLISKLFYKDESIIYIGENDYAKYLVSDYILEEPDSVKINKEESLSTTLEIQYYIDSLLDKSSDRNAVLKTILIDIITSQNYRNIDYIGILPSDLSQSEYYVLNGKTIKKSVLFDSLYRNYYEELSSIINNITDNYEELDNLLLDIINDSGIEYEKYLYVLKTNIDYIYTKDNTEKALSNILDEDEKYISRQDYEFLKRLDNMRVSLGLESKKLVKKEAGYINILTLVLSVILFGISIAFIMIKG